MDKLHTSDVTHTNNNDINSSSNSDNKKKRKKGEKKVSSRNNVRAIIIYSKTIQNKQTSYNEMCQQIQHSLPTCIYAGKSKEMFDFFTNTT